MSESQERMMAVVEPDHVERFLEICRKWDVQATVVGEVTGTGRLVIDWHGETVVDVDPRTVAHEGPVYERPYARPQWQDGVQARDVTALARPGTDEELGRTVLALAGSPNLCDKSWVTDQYDRYVRGNSVLAQPEDAGVLRIDEDSQLGVALATDCNARFTLLDPRAGAKLALAEAYRNVSVTGAQPVAVSDCLNFGSPEDPDVMWQFVEAVEGLVEGCAELGTPVTGGNVSLYNQTGDTPILPTPTVAVLGVLDDVTRRVPMGFCGEGESVWLLGTTRDELAGSAWAQVAHDHLGGLPPSLDLQHEIRLSRLLQRASRQGLLSSAHDLSDGGLSQALVECCLRRGHGVSVRLEGDPFVQLFSESTGRVLVSLPGDRDDQLRELAGQHEIPLTRLAPPPPPARTPSSRSSTASGSRWPSSAPPGRRRSPPPSVWAEEDGSRWVGSGRAAHA